MKDQNGRSARVRHTATGAVAALAAVGAIAGTAALAANPHGKAAEANGSSQTAPAPTPGKAPADPSQPFLVAVEHLVNDGAITQSEGRVVDHEIVAGRLDTQTLASSGLNQTQLQAVVQTLDSVKRAQASAMGGSPSARKSAAPASGSPAKSPMPGSNADNPFLIAVRGLVNDGTITASEGQIVDRQVLAGSLDPRTLSAAGFTQAQLQAVTQTLENAKRALAASG